MNKEDYVSFDVAKLLKEKGFSGETSHYYDEGKLDSFTAELDFNYDGIYISAPTLWDAQKWLRKSSQIWVTVFPEYDKRHEVVVYRVRITGYWDLLDNKKGELLSLWFEKYEQALNEGIKEALKMI